jgi:transcription elongation factor/antiterminator RfaH
MVTKNWFCLYTKAKQEDIVSFKLLKHPGIEIFNPKLKRKKTVRGRLTEVVEGLFPCYLFSRFDPYEFYHMIKYTRGVKRIVGNKEGFPYIIDEDLLKNIKERMVEGYIKIVPPRFEEGETVLIGEGPFKGLSGVFIKDMKASERVLILLNTLHYSAKVQVEKAFLSKP